MPENDQKPDSALRVNEGIEQPEAVSSNAAERIKGMRKREASVEDLLNGILSGDRTRLSQAITLVESALVKHQDTAQEIVTRCLPHSGRSIRVGITGVPGVGKSTFIESLGKHLTQSGHRIAVLAIDPSSQRSKGSILGDKTRMEDLANDPNAYIRPSASSGTLGSVARKTRESITLCEAAGFDIIFVETVGVGQSETAVHSMVDFFLLLMLAGAGDELQGIKRGIMEMADALVINKADGDNVDKAKLAKAQYENALHLFPPGESSWTPKVRTCSAVEHSGIEEIWKMVKNYQETTLQNSYFEKRRKEQTLEVLYDAIDDNLKSRFYSAGIVSDKLKQLEKSILKGSISPYQAAQDLLESYLQSLT